MPRWFWGISISIRLWNKYNHGSDSPCPAQYWNVMCFPPPNSWFWAFSPRQIWLVLSLQEHHHWDKKRSLEQECTFQYVPHHMGWCRRHLPSAWSVSLEVSSSWTTNTPLLWPSIWPYYTLTALYFTSYLSHTLLGIVTQQKSGKQKVTKGQMEDFPDISSSKDSKRLGFKFCSTAEEPSEMQMVLAAQELSLTCKSMNYTHSFWYDWEETGDGFILFVTWNSW